MQDILDGIKRAILVGEEEETKKLVADGLEKGLEPRRIMEEAMMPAMEDIGERFSSGEAFIPELIVAAEAMRQGMEVLKPHLAGAERGSGLILLGTVHGDIHSIGKNLVRMCMEGAGFEVVDIGEDVKTEKFVEAFREHRPDILGLSALLSSTMQRIPEVVEAVRAEDKNAVIMVGGGAGDPGFRRPLRRRRLRSQRLRGRPQSQGAPKLTRDEKHEELYRERSSL